MVHGCVPRLCKFSRLREVSAIFRHFYNYIVFTLSFKCPECVADSADRVLSPGSDWPGGLPGDSRWAGGPARWQHNYYDIIVCWPLILLA